MSCWTKEELENMLEDVVNELELSDGAVEKHGQIGTAPSELVRLVLEQKDNEIAMLKRGYVAGAKMATEAVLKIIETRTPSPSTKCKCEERGNMLEDVCNELDLSELAIDHHGQHGTPPAELVRLVLQEKDIQIRALKQGFVSPSPSAQKVIDAVKDWQEAMEFEAQESDTIWPVYNCEDVLVKALTAYQKERSDE